MADYGTVRQAGAGVRTAEIDEGLRAHMSKVYGLMSVGMIITALAAWAVAGLAVSTEPTAYQIGVDKYLTAFGAAMFASPLKWVVMLCAAGLRVRAQRRHQPHVGGDRAAGLLRLRRGDGRVDQLDLPRSSPTARSRRSSS